jgi:hypothetical protein
MADGCYYPVWGKGYCKSHQYLRTDKKPKKTPVEVKGTRRNDSPFGFEDQSSLFDYLWQEAKDARGRVFCDFTGENLNRFYNTPLYYNCFAHLLPKGRYTYFKLNPANIQIVFPEFHRIVDQGTREERKEYPGWRFYLWDIRVENMKEEYLKYKKLNLLR